MHQFIAGVIGLLLTFPPLVFILTYYLSHLIYRIKKKAFHQAMEFSSLFFLIGNLFILVLNYDFDYLGFVLLFLILLFLVFIIVQWRLLGDIIIKRLTKLYLRTLFLLNVLTYFILVIHTIGTAILS